MIYILHGENISKSRSLIVNQQKKLAIETKTEVDINDITANQLYEMGVAGSLFGDMPFIVLDVTAYRKQSAEDYINALNRLPTETNIIIFAQKTLSKTNPFLSSAEILNAKVLTNTIEEDSNVFRFVDNLFAKNRTATYQELNRLENAGTDQFWIFSMILYGLRNIFNYVYDSPKLDKMKSFQIDKLKKQSEKFSKETVQKLFNDLYGIEKRAKTGSIEIDMFLTSAIEKVLNS